jgi:hypothetical protein
MKPLGTKAYGHIPHLPGSKAGPGDHYCSPGHARIATEKARDKNDVIICQEKLDGSCCSVFKADDYILYPLVRAGHIANTSKYKQHHLFYNWVFENQERFLRLLKPGERACGEWLAQAHGTRYELPHEPFVIFDIMEGHNRITYSDLFGRATLLDFTVPYTFHIGPPISIEKAMENLKISGHGALEPVEGAIWRVERKGQVEFIVKYVRPDCITGKYLPEKGGVEIWNWLPKKEDHD